jgi:copper chaperone CopZ
MKNSKKSYLFALIMPVIMVSCWQKKQPPAPLPAEPVKVEMAISGMMCEGCVETVRSSIVQLNGIDSVSVSLDSANAVVVFQPGVTDTIKMRKAVELNGYKVTGTRTIGH